MEEKRNYHGRQNHFSFSNNYDNPINFKNISDMKMNSNRNRGILNNDLFKRKNNEESKNKGKDFLKRNHNRLNMLSNGMKSHEWDIYDNKKKAEEKKPITYRKRNTPFIINSNINNNKNFNNNNINNKFSTIYENETQKKNV